MTTHRILLFIFLSLSAILPLPTEAGEPQALLRVTGAKFEGGAKDLFGSDFDGEQVNDVYALPTGAHATMKLTFLLKNTISQPLFVYLKARDDDYNTHCAIVIKLNGRTLFKGRNTFSSTNFDTEQFAIRERVLNEGENTLVIACLEKEGEAGMPPWFQVAGCAIAPERYVMRQMPGAAFVVDLPAHRQPFPEPLPAGAQCTPRCGPPN